MSLKTAYHCPVSERAAYEEAVWLPLHLFLGRRKDTDVIAEAILKVCMNIEELRDQFSKEHRVTIRLTVERVTLQDIE